MAPADGTASYALGRNIATVVVILRQRDCGVAGVGRNITPGLSWCIRNLFGTFSVPYARTIFLIIIIMYIILYVYMRVFG